MDCLPHLHLAAYHATPGYRGDTPGIGVLCRSGGSGDLLAGVGIMRNSVGATSAYAAIGWQPLRIGPVRIGGYGGVINGYPYRDGAPFPFAAGLISIPTGRAEWHLSLLPAVPGISPATAGLSATWKF